MGEDQEQRVRRDLAVQGDESVLTDFALDPRDARDHEDEHQAQVGAGHRGNRAQGEDLSAGQVETVLDLVDGHADRDAESDTSRSDSDVPASAADAACFDTVLHAGPHRGRLGERRERGGHRSGDGDRALGDALVVQELLGDRRARGGSGECQGAVGVHLVVRHGGFLGRCGRVT